MGIIVLDVGIALAAEQVLEARHWKRIVAAEDRALAEEVQSNHGALFARMLMRPCIDRRLGELAEIFRRHDAGEPLGLIVPIGRPTFFIGSTATLEMAIADQSLSHMSLDRKQTIFATYGASDALLSAGTEKLSGGRTLQSLDHAGTLDANDWRELRRAYDAVSDSNQFGVFDFI